MGGISEFLTQTRLKNELSDRSFSGITTRVKVTSNDRGRFSILCDNGTGYQLANARAGAAVPGLVMALETGTGDNILVLRRGYVRNDNWNFTRGAKLYLDTYSGRIRQTPPSGPNDVVQFLGIAYDTHIIDFNPDATTMKISDSAPTTTTTTTLAPTTTTTTTRASQWYVIKNNNFWTSTEAVWHSDSGGYWQNADSQFDLTDIGTWTRGYRPSKFRITILLNGWPETGTIYLYDASNNILSGGSVGSVQNNVPKTLEWAITFQGTTVEYDIDRIRHSVSADGPFKITNIEFYGQYVPGSGATTTTTTVAATTTTTAAQTTSSTTTAAGGTTSTTTAAGGTTSTTTTSAATTTTTTAVQ